jgi:hypothetical protein
MSARCDELVIMTLIKYPKATPNLRVYTARYVSVNAWLELIDGWIEYNRIIYVRVPAR